MTRDGDSQRGTSTGLAALRRRLSSPWALLPVGVAAILVPLIGSLDRDFYALEADLILAAQLDLAGMREILAGTLKDQSPLYLWILHVWIAVFGDGDLTIRSVGFLWGAAAVGYTYLLGRSWRGHWVGLAAAALLVCMPAFTEHARTARMYVIYFACVVGAMAHASRYLRGGRAWELLGCGALCVAGIFNHFLGFGLAALALTYLVGGSLVAPPRRRAMGGLVTAAGVAVASLPQMLRFSAAWSRAGNKGTFYSVAGSVEEFIRTVNLDQFFHGARLGDVIPLPAPWPFWIVFGFMTALMVRGLLRLDRRWDQLFAVAWFAGGEAVMLYLRMARSADIRGRYLCFVLPIAALLLASALVERRAAHPGATPTTAGRRAVRWATAVLLLALTVTFAVGTGSQVTSRTRPYGDVVAWIEQRFQDDDAIGAYPGWTHNGLRIYAEHGVFATGNVAMLRKRKPEGRMFFVVSRMAQHDPKRELAWLGENAFLVERKDFYRTRVFLYDFAGMGEARTAMAEQWHARLGADRGRGFRLLVGGDARFPSWTKPPSPSALVRIRSSLAEADLSVMTLAAPPLDQGNGPLHAHSVSSALGGRGVDAVAVLPYAGEPAGDAAAIADLLRGNLAAVWTDGDIHRAEAAGVTIAVVNAAVGASDSDGDGVVEQVRLLTREVDHVVVLAAWPPGPGGNSTATHRILGRRLLDAGASAVLGRSGGDDTPLSVDASGVLAPNLGTVVTHRQGEQQRQVREGRLLYLLLLPDGRLEVETFVVRPDGTGAPVPTATARVAFPPALPRAPVGYRFRDHLAEAQLSIDGGPQDGVAFEPYVPESRGERRPRTVRRWGDEWWQHVGEVDEVCGGFGRAAIWAHPVRNGEVVIRFPDVPLTDRLDGFLGVGDRSFNNLEKKRKKGRKKKARLEPTFVEVWVDGERLDTVSGATERGWRSFRVDTSSVAGTTREVTFRVHASSYANHWFSFDAWTVSPRSPAAAERQAAATWEPRIDLADRLDDARVGVRSDDSVYRDCSAPLKGTAYIAGEEKGPGGEGRLAHRRRCGAKRDSWNVVATTRQKAGGELRDCLWAHPADDAALEIEFPDVELGSVMSGYLAITDLALDKRDFPVHFEIEAGGELLYRATRATEPGWLPFALDTQPWRGAPTDVLVRVETDKQRWRHFCFALGVD